MLTRFKTLPIKPVQASQTKTNLLTVFFALTATFIAISSHAVVIEVTTTADQNGEDDSKCSLREAVHASLAKKPYGGCIAGQKFITDRIVLEDKAYVLNSEIPLVKRVNKFGRGISIVGASTIDNNQRDAITGLLGKRLPPKSKIMAPNGRLFNSARDGIDLTLTNVVVMQAGSPNITQGGAFLIGGGLTLTNVVLNNTRAQNGSAIFLEGQNSKLNAEKLVLQNSNASNGSVIAHFCADNLIFDKKNITIKDSSIIKNSANDAVLATCGTPTIEITNTTLSENTANKLIDFSKVTTFQEGSKTNKPKLTIKNSTLVNNQGGLYYNDNGFTTISTSILGFNQQDCVYIGDDIDKNTSLLMTQSLLTGDAKRPRSNGCQQRMLFTNDTDKTPLTDNSNTYVTSAMSNFLEPLNDYGLGLLGYLPTTNDAVNIKSRVSCLKSDKRGVSRNNTSRLNKQLKQSCNLGALERSKLTAIDDLNQTNISYRDNVERLKNIIEADLPNQLTDEQKKRFEDNQALAKKRLALFKAYYKEHSRIVFANVFDNDLPFEDTQGIALFPQLLSVNLSNDANAYAISVKSLGVASLQKIQSSDASLVLERAEPNLVCLWDNELQELIAYRKDGSLTPSSRFDVCEYTIKHVSGTTAKAKVAIKIKNLAPIAEDLTVETIGTEPTVTLNLLDSINDNADGANRTGEDFFYRKIQAQTIDPNTGTLVNAKQATNFGYVRIIAKPELGTLTFPDGEPVICPKLNASQLDTEKCYRGTNITYNRNNLTGKFDDGFTYQIYDCGVLLADGSCKNPLASNKATVRILSEENIEKTSIFSGGGSFGGFMLWLLGILTLVSRFAYAKKDH